MLLFILLFLIYKLFYKYYIFRNVKRDYETIFSKKTPIDDITKDKLVKYWNTSSYEDYFKYSLDSMRRCKNKKIILTGLCQDNGGNVLSMWLPFIKKIQGYFKDYRVIIVENDSLDNTRDLLLREAEHDHRFIVLCDQNRPENTKTCKLGLRSIQNGDEKETHLQKRLSVLRKFRQVYWDYIKDKYGDYDYMAVIDWDLQGELSLPGFFHGLYYIEHHCDVIASNSFHKMKNDYQFYDTFPLLNNHRCHDLQQNKLVQDHMMKIKMYTKTLYGSAYPVPVESAFGGIALYNIPQLIRKQSSYLHPHCPIECEHSTFHHHLDVYIDPWMTFYIIQNHH